MLSLRAAIRASSARRTASGARWCAGRVLLLEDGRARVIVGLSAVAEGLVGGRRCEGVVVVEVYHSVCACVGGRGVLVGGVGWTWGEREGATYVAGEDDWEGGEHWCVCLLRGAG